MGRDEWRGGRKRRRRGRRGKGIYFHCTCEWNEMNGEVKERGEKEGTERKEGKRILLSLHLCLAVRTQPG